MSTYQSRLLAAQLTREAHVAAFGGSGQTQAQYCRDRGLNATTFSGWLRIARVARRRRRSRSRVAQQRRVASLTAERR